MTDHETGGATAAERIEAAAGRVRAVEVLENLEEGFSLFKGILKKGDAPRRETVASAKKIIEAAGSAERYHSKHLTEDEVERIAEIARTAATSMEESGEGRLRELRSG